MVVESSAESTAPFKRLPEAVQAKIIDGMTEALAEDELRFRGHWNIESTKVSDWKNGTIAALLKGVHRDYDFGKGFKKTLTGYILAKLARDTADEFEIYPPSLLDPIRRVFQRSADTLEAGFTEYSQTRKYRGRAIGTGFSYPGQTRSTNPQNPHCAGMGRGIL